MDEQEVLEVIETTTSTTQQTTTTTTTTQAQEITTQDSQTQLIINSSGDYIFESMPDNSQNVIHQLFAELGCNLDYTPTSPMQCFTMALQFAAALWFIWWLIKMVYSVMREMFKG